MAAETFGWTPLFGGSASVKPRVKGMQLGDGYAQRIPDGINSMPRMQQLGFRERPVVCDAIETFLQRHAGVRWFWFAYPGRGRIKVKCAEWTRQYPAPGMDEISLQFEQVFDPGE